MEKALMAARYDGVKSYLRANLDGVSNDALTFTHPIVTASGASVSSTNIKSASISITDPQGTK